MIALDILQGHVSSAVVAFLFDNGIYALRGIVFFCIICSVIFLISSVYGCIMRQHLLVSLYERSITYIILSIGCWSQISSVVSFVGFLNVPELDADFLFQMFERRLTRYSCRIMNKTFNNIGIKGVKIIEDHN